MGQCWDPLRADREARALGLPWCLLPFGSLIELSLALLAAVKSATGTLRILHAKLLS